MNKIQKIAYNSNESNDFIMTIEYKGVKSNDDR